MKNHISTSLNEFITENITSKILYHGSYSDDIKEFRLKSNNIVF